jgi:hypothetical protein
MPTQIKLIILIADINILFSDLIFIDVDIS